MQPMTLLNVLSMKVHFDKSDYDFIKYSKIKSIKRFIL